MQAKEVIRSFSLLIFLSLPGCYSDSGDGFYEFPRGEYCFNSENESILIDDGILKARRKKISEVPLLIKIGARAGTRYISPQEMLTLRFDDEGEYIDYGYTSADLWGFGQRNSKISDIYIASIDKNHETKEVTFKRVPC